MTELQKAIQKKDRVDQSSYLTRLGNLYKDLGRYDTAIHYHLQDVDISSKAPPRRQSVAVSYSNIGACYTAKKDYVEALKWYVKMITVIKNSTDAEFPNKSFEYYRAYSSIEKVLTDWADLQKTAIDNELQNFEDNPDLSKEEVDTKKEWLNSLSKQLKQTVEYGILFSKKALQLLRRDIHNSRKVLRTRGRQGKRKHQKHRSDSSPDINSDPDEFEVRYNFSPVLNLALLYEMLDDVPRAVTTFKEAVTYAVKPVSLHSHSFIFLFVFFSFSSLLYYPA